MPAAIDYLDGIETGLCIRLNRLGRSWLVARIFTVVSRLGDGWYWLGMAVALLSLQGAAAQRPLTVIFAIAMAGTVLYKSVKHRLVRERPFINITGIQALTPPLDRYSFPSGHTLHAVSFALLFSHAEPLLTWWVWSFALLAAFSRVVLGLHYPSDVLAGAVIGAVLGLFGVAMF